MSERYPDDSVLLGLVQDGVTGVEYIETGASPYVLAFRRLVQRVLLSGQRANDLRVYQDGDLSVGVRSGRCYIGGAGRAHPGVEGVSVASDATTYFWLDAAGVLQSGVGLPVDRTGFVPLAEVVTGSSSITSVTDLRGEAFLAVPDLGVFGVTATGAEINQVVAGVAGTVDAAALGVLTGGPETTADSEHRHLQVYQDVDGEAYFKLINDGGGVDANVGLVFSLPNQLVDDTVLVVDRSNGFLGQRYNGVTYQLVGVVHERFGHEGDVTGSLTGKLVGVVPGDGVVTDVVLSVGANMQSSVGADGVSAAVKVNGVVVTGTDPAVSSLDGAGMKSTAQGDGVAAVVKSDGTQVVQRGDVLTVDVTRTAGGTVSVEARDLVVMVVVKLDGPE